MSDAYRELLEAALQHVEELKATGVQYLPVSPEALADLDWLAKANPVRLMPTKSQPALSKAIPTTNCGASSTTESSSEAIPEKRASQSLHDPAVVEATSTVHVTNLNSALPAGSDSKAIGIAELRERALVCQKCPHLAKSRKNVVFGVGDIHSPLMFVGEAPGADEDEQGEPFVGAAGRKLTQIIQAMGFSRETVYIANVLKCRPDTPGQTAGNRKPSAEEMKTCLPYLLAQIDLIRPKVIVALGGTAVEGLLGMTVGITKFRGRFQMFRGVPVMPTYHPSYLLRNQSPSVKREVWEDMLQVLEKLGHPISEKQRNYFLKPT